MNSMTNANRRLIKETLKLSDGDPLLAARYGNAHFAENLAFRILPSAIS
jgi:hypothetical protein